MEMGVKKTSYGNKKTILIGQDSFYCALPIKVIGAANSTIHAGAPLGEVQSSGYSNIIKRFDTIYEQVEDDVANGILLHDVTLDSKGNGNGTLVIAGCIDISKLPLSLVSDIQSSTFEKCHLIFVEGEGKISYN